MKPRIHNNARIFELRGNPWSDHPRPPSDTQPMTKAEAAVDAALRRHNLPGARFAAEIRDKYRKTEDPDIDSFTKAKKAPSRPVVEPRPRLASRSVQQSLQRKIAAARYSINQAIKPKFVQKAREGRVQEVLASGANDKVKPYWVYFKTEDGEEQDLERGALKAAEKSFDRLVKRKDVLAAEIWETETGECIRRWERSPKMKERKGK